MTVVVFTVTPGVRAGQQIVAQAPNGQRVPVQLPANTRLGQRMQVNVSAPSQLLISPSQLPAGAKPPKPPDHSGWRAPWSDKHNRWYWWNMTSRETTWTPPKTSTPNMGSTPQWLAQVTNQDTSRQRIAHARAEQNIGRGELGFHCRVYAGYMPGTCRACG